MVLVLVFWISHSCSVLLRQFDAHFGWCKDVDNIEPLN